MKPDPHTPSLFGEAHVAPESPTRQPPTHAPHVAGSETSRRAAAGVAVTLGARQREVLEWFQSRGAEGGTDNQCIAAMVQRGGSANGPRARRVELTRVGFLQSTGHTLFGSQLWAITPAGARWLHQEEPL